MTSDKVREYLRHVPFRPFEIRTSDGRVHAVDHPEFVKLYRHEPALNYTTDDDRDIIDLRHIVSLEVANVPAA